MRSMEEQIHITLPIHVNAIQLDRITAIYDEHFKHKMSIDVFILTCLGAGLKEMKKKK